MELFQCQDLNKQYAAGGFTLKRINLTLNASEITGVVGENGNGKTTLLRIIAGELAHDGGELTYFNQPNKEQNHNWIAIRERIAYIPQRIPKWYGYLKTNLFFQAAIHGIKGAEARFMIDDLLEKLGLTNYADLKWSQISTGYRLRFQLAKMLIGQPDLLVLDEPIANLDINAQEKFLADLRNIVSDPERKVSVILSSQQLHEIENVSDKVVFLRKGEMIYGGDVSKIGETRKQNVFELQTSLTADEMDRLPIDNAKFSQTGKTYTIKTDLTITGEMLIKVLLENGAKIHYFRDISSSTRRFFNE